MTLTAGPLTVKHIEANGHQTIRQALSVAFDPGDKDHPTAVFAIGTPDMPEACQFDNGKVYVMNEAGATVANYDLT